MVAGENMPPTFDPLSEARMEFPAVRYAADRGDLRDAFDRLYGIVFDLFLFVDGQRRP